MPTKGEVRADGKIFYRLRRKLNRPGTKVDEYEVWVTPARWSDLEAKRLARNQARVDKYQGDQAYRDEFKQRVKAHHAVDYRRRMMTMARSRHKHEGVPFNLTLDDIPHPTHCPALGTQLVVGDRWNAPSLDRIMPGKGYVKGNVVVVSMLANLIKAHATPAQVMKVAEFYVRLTAK